jgi:transposase
MLLTGGQTADIRMALDLLQGVKANKLIADKGYDSNWLLYYLDSEGIEAVIPPKKSRLQQRTTDYQAYKQRNVIERTINKLKQYRKIATRYEKTATSFLSLCCLAATFINLNL